MIVVSINKVLRSNLDLEIMYEFCMEIGPCGKGYRCLALVDIHKVQGVVRPFEQKAAEGFFFRLEIGVVWSPFLQLIYVEGNYS